MSDRSTLAHFLHDAGLAAWFGGTLMGATAVNSAAAGDPQAAQVANTSWVRWTPFNAAAIGAHLLGGALLLKENKGRVRHQKGVLGNTKVKLALTAGAAGATLYSRVLGQKVIAAGDVPVDGQASTPDPEVAKAQRQLKALQWAIPGLTGAVLASSSLHEEQQRPVQVLRGSLQNLPGRAGPALDKARETASPALEKAREAATHAYELAADRAKALPVHG